MDAVLEDSTSESEPDIPPVQDASMEQWPSKHFYGQLGAPNSATLQEITKAYRKLARSCHPDKCVEAQVIQATEYLKMVIDAYELLKDEKRRKKYDEIQEFFVPTLQFNPITRVRNQTELAQLKTKPKVRRLMLESQPKATEEVTKMIYETGPNAFDSYASEGSPFDTWWSEGTLDDWE